MSETRTFTRAELEAFLKDGGECRPQSYNPNSSCYYSAAHAYPYRYGAVAMNSAWIEADDIRDWVIIKQPNVPQLTLSDLYPKRIHL